jgi:tetratricopeptide (TPR) repeat protein
VPDKVKYGGDDFSKALALNPRLSQASLMLGRTYCLLRLPEKAVSAYQNYIELRPDNPLGHLELGFAHEALCRYDDPDPPEDRDAGVVPNPCQDPQLTAKMRDAWVQAGVTAKDFYDRGRALETDERLADSLVWYQRAALLNPEDWRSWYRMGLVHYRLDAWNKADGAFKQAIQRSPQDREFWYQLGMIYEEQQMWEEAVHTYQTGVEASPGHVGVSNLYFRVGLIQQTSLPAPNLEAAEKNYRAGLDKNEFSFDPWQKAAAYARIAQILTIEERWDEAMVFYENAIALDPSVYWIHVSASRLAWQLDDRDRAMQLIESAIDLNPDGKNAYLAKADFLEESGDSAGAIALYRLVLEIDPGDRNAREALRGLESGH